MCPRNPQIGSEGTCCIQAYCLFSPPAFFHTPKGCDKNGSDNCETSHSDEDPAPAAELVSKETETYASNDGTEVAHQTDQTDGR